jgi:hypothetical protein
VVFDVAETVPHGWDRFDVAFSHEVICLIHDLAFSTALRPGTGRLPKWFLPATCRRG